MTILYTTSLLDLCDAQRKKEVYEIVFITVARKRLRQRKCEKKRDSRSLQLLRFRQTIIREITGISAMLLTDFPDTCLISFVILSYTYLYINVTDAFVFFFFVNLFASTRLFVTFSTCERRNRRVVKIIYSVRYNVTVSTVTWFFSRAPLRTQEVYFHFLGNRFRCRVLTDFHKIIS